MKLFGLLGTNINYSFSKNHFTKKFKKENLASEYKNFDINNINELPIILNNTIQNLVGFNVTIPFKETIFNYLDEIDVIAQEIGAVNTVKIVDNTYLKGYNTDHYGFVSSIKPLLKKHHKKALILGNGGATKAIKYGLIKLGIDFTIVSRKPKKNIISYGDLTSSHFENCIVINCTPIGTFPEIKLFPNIPYEFLNAKNLLYDLVYNPTESVFLKKGKSYGAQIKNGLEMLVLQAEESWKIWND